MAKNPYQTSPGVEFVEWHTHHHHFPVTETLALPLGSRGTYPENGQPVLELPWRSWR